MDEGDRTELNDLTTEEEKEIDKHIRKLIRKKNLEEFWEHYKEDVTEYSKIYWSIIKWVLIVVAFLAFIVGMVFFFVYKYKETGNWLYIPAPIVTFILISIFVPKRL